MLLANVIFHAFQAAYVSMLFLAPLAIVVLVLEGVLLWVFNRDTPLRSLIFAVILMNVASYVLGLWISPHLYVGSGLVVLEPDEHGYGILDRGPNWEQLARYSFLQAGLVSFAIEAGLLLCVARLLRIRHVVLPVGLGNLASYGILYLGFFAMLGS